MARFGVVSYKRKAQAKKHADCYQVWTGPLCGSSMSGNGGISSHKKAHGREMNLTHENFGFVVSELREWADFIGGENC